jgi:hypothetical protein
MILIKGYDVQIQLEGGGWLNPPVEYGIIHDPDGVQLPKCSVYIGPYKRSSIRASMTSDAKKYFGNSYVGVQAITTVPVNSDWKYLGNSIQIRYRRVGKYKHKYFHFFKGNTVVQITKCDKYYRIQLPEGCIVNWRGFVYP